LVALGSFGGDSALENATDNAIDCKIFNFQVVARLVCSEGLLAGGLLKRADNQSLVRLVEPISLGIPKNLSLLETGEIRRSSYHRHSM
jgi:hypothetical protein